MKALADLAIIPHAVGIPLAPYGTVCEKCVKESRCMVERHANMAALKRWPSTRTHKTQSKQDKICVVQENI